MYLPKGAVLRFVRNAEEGHKAIFTTAREREKLSKLELLLPNITKENNSGAHNLTNRCAAQYALSVTGKVSVYFVGKVTTLSSPATPCNFPYQYMVSFMLHKAHP
ncbi:hypothetical protein POVWA2_021280 [Plasmodium ovale wallikeri]|uniref:Uncharacterized protein n=1 Tax=Plasmodium ovale wallikeri TaxID=864142 RepID=A0A1A8YST6_PLAOA|nr:hypothetical protein POVWA1_021310 [Plasmodium ovale wallikeri]SBT34716.1 hypothetical protein POVWA2_021280 [Plasmodium ovale wallikeri]